MTADRDPGAPELAAVRGNSRGPSPGFAVLLLVVVVVAAVVVAFVSAPGPSPLPTASTPAIALVSPSASAGSATATPVAAPSASSSIPSGTVMVLRNLADPAGVLGALAGCTNLIRVTGQASPDIQGLDVDAVADEAGRDSGWLFVPPGIQAVTRVWLGNDVVELARAAGRQVVGIGVKGDVWLGGPAGATRWRPVPTPKGRTAWVITADEVTGGRCGPWPVPETLWQQRAVTCAGVNERDCLQLTGEVELAVPSVFSPGGDVAIVERVCGLLDISCAAVPPTAAAVPPAWPGDAAQVHAVEVGRDTYSVLSPGVAPALVLDTLSLPALPLPVAGASTRGAACAGTISGLLGGAPWDPRVAWVGNTPVVWPAGSTARFTPRLRLLVPTGDGSLLFVPDAPIALTGHHDAATGSFVACQARPAVMLP